MLMLGSQRSNCSWASRTKLKEVGPIRLTFIIAVVLGGLFGAVAVGAQEAAKVARIGYLVLSSNAPRLREAFRQGLRDLGYVEGRNLVIESDLPMAGTSGTPRLRLNWLRSRLMSS